MRAINVIMLASLNKGKQKEFAELFGAHNIKVAPPDEFIRNVTVLNQVERHDKKATYYTNAKAKCMAAFGAAKVPTVADDSGIEVEALQGKPGMESALSNSKKLLEMMKGQSNRRARFRSVLVFQVEGVMLLAEGVCEGKLADAPKGKDGFGYDDIFIPDAGDGRTFAEMSREEKDKISHRKHAVADLVRQLEERNIQLVRP